MNWQPIETAPRDGTWMLVACGWRREGEDAIGGTIRWDIPTHWMPLPPPPTQADVTASAAKETPDGP